MSNPESVEDVEPFPDRLKRIVKECYCEKWSSDYAPVCLVGGTIMFALIGFTSDDLELSLYCLVVRFVLKAIDLFSDLYVSGSAVVAPLELHHRSERLRNLAAQMRLKDWAENPTNRGLVYLAMVPQSLHYPSPASSSLLCHHKPRKHNPPTNLFEFVLFYCR